MSIPSDLRRIVWERSGHRCEYCQMPQHLDPATFEIDHVIPEKMDGETAEGNLALACFKCNDHKGPNIAGIDPSSGEKAFLYDPRKHIWSAYFRWDGAILIGLTPMGRTTVALLQINDDHRAAHRRQLISEGVFPPSD